MHVSKKSQREDMKSTAYAFTLVGIAGIILLILFITGVLPIQTAGYMKIIMSVVMGGTFGAFLIIGLRSFGKLKQLGEEADSEETLLSEICDWFHSSYTAADIDQNLDDTSSEETLYFGRYEVMKQHILAKYPDLEEDFLDNLIETLYTDIFS